MTIIRNGAADTRGYQLGHLAVLAMDDDAVRIGEWLRAAGFDTIIFDEEAELTAVVDAAGLDILFVPVPVGDALEGAVRRLRALTEAPIIAIIPRFADPLAVYGEGADHVITAAVGRNELVARTRALLRRTRVASARERRATAFGGLDLPTGECTLRIGDASLALDATEAAFFSLLISNGGKVTSRRTLAVAAGVREPDLDGFIRRVRQRLEAIEGWRRIVTQRGVGVRLLESPMPTLVVRRALSETVDSD